jgi:NadR type nicotinamide-nucleotide adenylyltransferase
LIPNNQIKKIIVSGPESTGKTTLCKELSEYYNTLYIAEYAREYVEKRSNIYTFVDVEKIAERQIQELNKKYTHADKFVFFDTGLIITKVWFEEVFGRVPVFLINALESIKIDFCLLCYPDLEWIPDNVRVNKGKKRIELFTKYQKELIRYKINYAIVKGTGEARNQSAKKSLNSAYCL